MIKKVLNSRVTVSNADTIQRENELPPSENKTADRKNFLADRRLGTAAVECELRKKTKISLSLNSSSTA